MEGADEAEKSLRVKGVSLQMRAVKTPWRPANLLVLVLHRVLGDDGEAVRHWSTKAGLTLHGAGEKWTDASACQRCCNVVVQASSHIGSGCKLHEGILECNEAP